jgi:hypothetical protein
VALVLVTVPFQKHFLISVLESRKAVIAALAGCSKQATRFTALTSGATVTPLFRTVIFYSLAYHQKLIFR